MSIRDKLRRGLTELGVVVLGVLIALSADRWVQNIDDRARGDTHLVWLLGDIEMDSIRYWGGIARETERKEWSRRLLLAAQSPNAAYDEDDRVYLLRAFERIGQSVLPAPQTATWSEMLAAGDLALIRDPELRRNLSAYQSSHESFRLGEEHRQAELARLERMTLKLNGPINVEESDDSVVKLEIGLSDTDLRRVLGAIRSDAELRSLIGYAGAVAAVRERIWSARVRTTSGAVTDRIRAALQGSSPQ